MYYFCYKFYTICMFKTDSLVDLRKTYDSELPWSNILKLIKSMYLIVKRAMTHFWVREALSYPVVRNSASPSQGLWCGGRRSFSSTRPRPPWTLTARPRSSGLWTPLPTAEPPLWWATGRRYNDLKCISLWKKLPFTSFSVFYSESLSVSYSEFLNMSTFILHLQKSIDVQY